jgi:hypothetical protein
MKLLTAEPQQLVRLSINRQGEVAEYISIADSDVLAVKRMLYGLILKHGTPLPKGYRTSIVVRQYEGSKAGRSESVSFYGKSPKEIKEIIINHLKEK